jgi:RNA polymerase sigma-70 factor, ECF subfamily
MHGRPAVTVTRANVVSAPAVDAPIDWVATLSAPGSARDLAIRDLHALLLRAARVQVTRMGAPASLGDRQADEIVNQAADDALVAILGKLATFEGRSRFTTWAYKFAVLNAAVEVRRRMWERRPVPLDEVELIALDPTPGHYAEAADLAAAVRSAVQDALSPHQRRVLIALVVEEIPIDILAERLGTSRNALYKNLHDARVRLRTDLIARGFLDPPRPREASA